MKFKIVAFSDTHLGEDNSLLSFPHGRQHLWKSIRELLKIDEKIEVDELILLGDIPDRTLSSTSQIITHTNAFVRTLGSLFEIKRAIYIPGNHDHTIWTDYRSCRYGRRRKYGITPPSGEIIVDNGQIVVSKPKCIKTILNLFFGYPVGSLWRSIKGKRSLSFFLSNPLYATVFRERLYVFTHGTHFKKEVTINKYIKKIADYLELDELLGNIEIKSDCDVKKARSLEELEVIAAPFVDSLWPSSGNNPTSQSDQF